MPQTLKLTISIELPEGASVQVEPSNGDGLGNLDETIDEMELIPTARNLLVAAGVDNPDGILSVYAPARVIDVCTAARHRGGRLTNRAAWIVSALRKNWTIKV